MTSFYNDFFLFCFVNAIFSKLLRRKRNKTLCDLLLQEKNPLPGGNTREHTAVDYFPVTAHHHSFYLSSTLELFTV